jgi:hypothetical protein
MTNHQRLEDAEILKKGAKLTAKQEKGIESLTEEEVEVMISGKKKQLDDFPPEDLAVPITHHH